ncbi:MAG: hypothetical protein KAS32_10875 [Candidatus Peribacteraceae bacterium]|nr:hypothetical protein [Candidatus Peribacteraceae bacterium]
MKYKKNERLEVDWLDVVDDPAWMDESKETKIPPESYCRSMGYFYKQDDVGLWLSPSINHRKSRGQRSTVFIPKGMITKIRKLAIKRKD